MSVTYRHKCSACGRETEDMQDYQHWTWVEFRPHREVEFHWERDELCPSCFATVHNFITQGRSLKEIPGL